MINHGINPDDSQTRQYVAEFLDARLAGVLGSDWNVHEYVARRKRDDERKRTGGLSAEDSALLAELQRHESLAIFDQRAGIQ